MYNPSQFFPLSINLAMIETFADQKRKTVETAEFTEDGRYKR